MEAAGWTAWPHNASTGLPLLGGMNKQNLQDQRGERRKTCQTEPAVGRARLQVEELRPQAAPCSSSNDRRHLSLTERSGEGQGSDFLARQPLPHAQVLRPGIWAGGVRGPARGQLGRKRSQAAGKMFSEMLAWSSGQLEACHPPLMALWLRQRIGFHGGPCLGLGCAPGPSIWPGCRATNAHRAASGLHNRPVRWALGPT